MKLLSTPQGKSQRELDTANQELRAIQLDGIIRDKRKELADLEVQESKMLSEKGRQNYEEEKLWKVKIATLTTEVEALESRRKSALVPLEEREKEADDRDSVLLKREEMVLIKESENDRVAESLQDKLDAVSEREESAVEHAKRLNSREFAINFQEAQLKERMAALTVILQESLAETLAAQQEAARYKAMLKGRDVSIAEREKFVEQQLASFENREKAIIDKYRTLQRATTEVNLNHGNRSPRPE